MDKKKIIKLAKKDFERAWVESGNLVKKSHPDKEYPRLKYEIGKSHILNDTIAMLREAYLRLGFSEAVNPLFIDKNDVYKKMASAINPYGDGMSVRRIINVLRDLDMNNISPIMAFGTLQNLVDKVRK